MTLEEVQKMSRYRNPVLYVKEQPFFIAMWFIYTASAILIAALINETLSAFIWMASFIFIITLALLIFNALSMNPRHWEDNYVKPYLDLLPVTDKVIEIVSIKPYDLTQYYVKYTYLDEHVLKYDTTLVELICDLPVGNKPIFEFKVVDQHLSFANDRYKPGHYQERIHLPSDFSLLDILQDPS